MAKFFLGQRVRKVAGPNAGFEARIVGLGPYPAGFFPNGDYLDEAAEVAVAYMVPWHNVHGNMMSADRTAYTYFDLLEPIQPSGHRAGNYSLSELLDRCTAGEGVAA